jgi:hypothetical protein
MLRMGRATKITDEHWARIERTDFLKMAHRLCTPSYSEQYAVDLLHVGLILEEGERMLDVPKIERYRFEFNLKGARADIILFHRDDGITIVEVKAGHVPRDVVAGIGQLCLYEAMVPEAFKSNPPKYVRKVLAVPMAKEKAGNIIKACEIANVKLVLMSEPKEVAARYRAAWEANSHGA